LPDESEWYTSPELEELYNSRQTPPASYDATAIGQFTNKKQYQSNYFYLSKMNQFLLNL
jgi:hypothetical protein